LEELAILKHAIDVNPRDARAHTLLGHWLYDRRRHREAIAHWEKAARLAPHDSVVLRCLGIGYFNILRQPAKARRAYTAARRSNPTDARLLYEADQLAKRLGDSPVRRLHTLERHPDLVAARDDLTVEFCALLNQTGQPQRALPLVAARRFQPWEGGEGQALGQHVRTHLLLGRAALASGDPSAARRQFEVALAAPENLGEAKHLLANQSDLHFWLGEACAAEGDHAVARRHWREAAEFKGDFQEMSVRTFSELTYYSALAWRRLGRRKRAEHLLRDLLAYARTMAKTPAKLDYFATSLPTMLLFTDDLERRQETTAIFLEAQAHLGLGRTTVARRLLCEILRRDPSHALAADLITS
jgi:tetratricopeptide (TPR) repeat protein